ncbi:MAG: NAD(P)-dependent oxidoreductase [Gemmataceae bacterium]|nr:NAD(P)-dependent oxidoreductase [Gemmataceae bacterium]
MIGRWLIALGRDLRDIAVLTRDPARARTRISRWIDPASVSYLDGTAADFRIDRQYHSLIHLAGDPASATFNAAKAEEYVRGVENTWRQAEKAGIARALLVSSGAVAGPHDGPITEDDRTSDESSETRAQYARSRRRAEQLVGLSPVPTVIARVFAVIGPDMSADGPLAAGQFLAAARRHQPVRVERGGAIRSYLDHVDLVRWLTTILESGAPGRVYNVGSEEAVSLAELASRIARIAGVSCAIADNSPAERYVPATTRAGQELGLRATVDLDSAIQIALTWQPRIR